MFVRLLQARQKIGIERSSKYQHRRHWKIRKQDTTDREYLLLRVYWHQSTQFSLYVQCWWCWWVFLLRVWLKSKTTSRLERCLWSRWQTYRSSTSFDRDRGIGVQQLKWAWATWNDAVIRWWRRNLCTPPLEGVDPNRSGLRWWGLSFFGARGLDPVTHQSNLFRVSWRLNESHGKLRSIQEGKVEGGGEGKVGEDLSWGLLENVWWWWSIDRF